MFLQNPGEGTAIKKKKKALTRGKHECVEGSREEKASCVVLWSHSVAAEQVNERKEVCLLPLIKRTTCWGGTKVLIKREIQQRHHNTFQQYSILFCLKMILQVK